MKNPLLPRRFHSAAKLARPEFSTMRIAANVGETRQNFHKALESGASTDRVIEWIIRWNEAHPKHQLKLEVHDLTDLTVVIVTGNDTAHSSQ